MLSNLLKKKSFLKIYKNHNYIFINLYFKINIFLASKNWFKQFFFLFLNINYYLKKCFELGRVSLLLEPYLSNKTCLTVFNKIFETDNILNNSKINDVQFLINKSLLLEEYYQIGIFAAFAVFLAVLIITASYISVSQKPESEKLSTYECGFEPYEDAKNKFDVQFYTVAILFVLFDIEIIVMLPWCLSLATLDILGYWLMIEFLLELGLAFIYAWCVGALDW